MQKRNICKFVTESINESLEIKCFIYESDLTIMKSMQHSKSKRAVLIRQGSGELTIENNRFRFESGFLFFVFENETFYIEPDGECEYMYINFSGTRAEALMSRFSITKANRCFAGFDGLVPLWYDSLSRASEQNIDLAAESVLLYTFSRLNASHTSQSNLVSRIIEITEASFSDPDLSVAVIAGELMYNAKYISHIFKKQMGITYSAYLRNLRIKYAVSLFDHGIDSVKNVSYLSGFSDPLYFSSVFRKVIGKSPKEYKSHI